MAMQSPRRPTLHASPRRSGTPRHQQENSTPVKDQWSRSKTDRFTGHGSFYNSALNQAPSSANKATPSKQSSSLKEGGRYATPAERLAGNTPSKSLSATFASATLASHPAL